LQEGNILSEEKKKLTWFYIGHIQRNVYASFIG
jgi:hypothetical protein